MVSVPNLITVLYCYCCCFFNN